MKLLPVWYKGTTVAQAKVDDRDYNQCSEFKWNYSPQRRRTVAYARAWDGKKYIYLHALVLGGTTRTLQGCHLNHNGLDNRRKNLALGTPRQNGLDRSQLQPNNTTGTTGIRLVTTRVRKRPWGAYIRIAGKQHERFFLSRKEAVVYRRELEKKYGKGKYTSAPLDPEGRV